MVYLRRTRQPDEVGSSSQAISPEDGAENTGTRASTRVRKPPQQFQKELPTQSQTQTKNTQTQAKKQVNKKMTQNVKQSKQSQKRTKAAQPTKKRQGKQAAQTNNAIDESDSSDKENTDISQPQNSSMLNSDDSDGDEDLSPQPKTKKGAEIAQGQAKPKKVSGQSQAKSKKNGVHVPCTSLLIFDQLKTGTPSAQDLVDGWIHQYKDDKQAAMLMLINALLRACGCKSELSLQIFRSEDMDDILEHLQEALGDTIAYPLISKQLKRFDTRLSDFVCKLITRLSPDELYDDYLLAKLSQWLLLLSGTRMRAFRHTASVVTFTATDALLVVRAKVNKVLDENQRQLETENKKKGKAVAKAKLKTLQDNNNTYSDQLKTITDHIGDLVTGCFVHRFRDVAMEIRILAIKALGRWLVNGKDLFLHDKYLKYAGWQLNDREPEVRLACVVALKGLYANAELHGQLESFTERFANRMCQMVDDINPSVSCEAIEVVSKIHSFGLVSPETIESIYRIIDNSNAKRVKAAGKFVFGQNFADDSEESLSSAAALVKFVRLFDEQRDQMKNETKLVQAMWSLLPCLQNWDLYCNLLDKTAAVNSTSTTEKPKRKAKGSDEQSVTLPDELELCLLEVLAAAVQHAVAPEFTTPLCGKDWQIGLGVGIMPRKKSSNTSKEKERQSLGRMAVTDRFIGTVGALWEAHAAHAERLECVVRVVRCFDQPTLSTSHRPQVTQLCKQIANSFLKSASHIGLQESSMELLSWLQQDDALRDIVDLTVTELANELQERLGTALDAFHEATGAQENNATVNLRAVVGRVRVLYGRFDLSSFNTLNQKVALIVDDAGEASVATEIAVSAIHTIFLCLMWQFRTLDPNNVDDTYATGLKHRTDIYISQLLTLVDTSPNPIIRIKSLLLVSDALVIFSKVMKDSPLHKVTHTLSTDEMELCKNFVLQILEGEISTSEDMMHGRLGDLDPLEGDDWDKAQEAINRKHVMGAFMRLISYGLVDVSYGAPFLTLYQDPQYIDLFKMVFQTLRTGDYRDLPRLLLGYLTLLYEERVKELLVDA
ncbi:hypothetical protein SARC_01862, partial [Sphaeroforma arctica JP610]